MVRLEVEVLKLIAVYLIGHAMAAIVFHLPLIRL
jgi:hypothetical protein